MNNGLPPGGGPTNYTLPPDGGPSNFGSQPYHALP